MKNFLKTAVLIICAIIFITAYWFLRQAQIEAEREQEQTRELERVERALEAQKAIENLAPEEVLVLFINREPFHEFLIEPCLTFLHREHRRLSVLRTDCPHRQSFGGGNYLRMGNWTASFRFIEFMLDDGNVRSLLLKHSIESEMLNHVIIAHQWYVPVPGQPITPGNSERTVVWVQTDEGSYFFEEVRSNLNEPITFAIYTHEEYAERWGRQ